MTALPGKIYCLCLLFTIFTLEQIHAETADQRSQYILSKLTFYYVQNPNSDSTAVRVTMVNNSKDPRDVMKLFNNGYMDKASKLLVAMLNDRQHGGDDFFQQRLSDLLKVRDVPIAIFLYNDKLPFEQFGLTHFISNVDRNGFLIPCATKDTTRGYKGYVHMGQHFLDMTEMLDLKYEFVRDIVTIQNLTEIKEDAFLVNDKYYTFGEDDEHDYNEIIPSADYAFTEGLADAFGFYSTIVTGSKPDLIGWFSPEREVKIETAVPAERPIPGKSPDIWMYKQLNDSNIQPIRKVGNFAFYKLNQLPYHMLFHSELLIATILYFSAFDIPLQQTASFTYYNNHLRTTYRDLRPFEAFVNALARQSLPDAMQEAQLASCQDYPKKQYHLLALAYIDYFTFYKAKTKAEFSSQLRMKLEKQLVDCYWEIRDKAKATATSIDNVDPFYGTMNINLLLGIGY